MDITQTEKRKVITARGNTKHSYWELLAKIEEAIKDGYVVPPEGKRWTADQPVLFGRQLRVVMYPADYDIPEPGYSAEKAEITSDQYLQMAREEETKQQELSSKADEIVEKAKSLSKKQDLLDYADELGLEIPEDVKAPKAIQAFIINSVE